MNNIKHINKIELYRTHIIINDYKLGSAPRLENCFQIYNPITHTYSYQGLEYIEETNQLILPRGIDVYFLENIFQVKAVNMNTYDDYEIFNDMQIKYLPRDNVQREALQFMLGVDKYQRTLLAPQLSVNLNTGKGKTYCAVCTAAYTGIKTIIITYSVKWLQQWKEFILEYTDTKEKEICMMINSNKIARTLKEDTRKYKFILTTHSSINSYAKNHGWDSIGGMFKTLKIGMKIYDEAHLNFKTMYMIDFHTNTFKTFYVTATPLRSDSGENQIYQYYMKNVPSIDLFDEEEDPHTDYIAIKFNSQPSINVVQACKNQYGLDRNAYMNYIVTNDNFYKILRIIMNMIITKGGKTLIYIGTINAIYTVYYWIINNYPEFRFNTCILTSETQDKEIINKNQIILSTTKSAGAAVDIPFLKRTVVLAEPFKSEILARQTLGRTRSNNTEYIEVVDKGFKSIPKWFLAKKPIFEKYALSCKTINISNRELDDISEKLILNRMTLEPPKYRTILHYDNTDRKSPLLYDSLG